MYHEDGEEGADPSSKFSSKSTDMDDGDASPLRSLILICWFFSLILVFLVHVFDWKGQDGGDAT
jgi:hypothetical protein